MSIRTTKFMGKTYRVVCCWEHFSSAIYADGLDQCYHVLQVRRFGFWFDLEKEEVPNHVWWCRNLLGDTSGWESALVKRFREVTGVWP